MRIIEGMGPPTPDTFGNSDYLYKDTETGAFYRCHGNINEDRTLPYFTAHKHPGEQYIWTPILYAEVRERTISTTLVPNGPSSSISSDIAVANAVVANPETVVIKNGDKEYPLVLDSRGEEGSSTVVWTVHDPYGEFYGNEAGRLYVDPADGHLGFQGSSLADITTVLSVLETTETVHKIDGKFMPEGYPYSTEEAFEETRYFTPSGPDGGFINDLEFAKLLYGNLDKATYTYSGYFASDAVETIFETLQDGFAYIQVKSSTGASDRFMVSIRTDSNGNLTGQILFGNDHFSNGSITIKGVKETIRKMDPKFLPDGTEVVYLYNGCSDAYTASKLAPEIEVDEMGRIIAAGTSSGPDVTRELADELFKKWVTGKVRIFVLSDTSLTMGGNNTMHEVLTMTQVAEDSGGGKWSIYANIVRYTDVVRIKIA